ncbi:MAG: DUF2344 domain-containing protein, partial [Moorea sp. SIO3C2]|nr:DUF2344 domain-containing protein [Moorena sp. SIO3C2]
RQVEQGEWNLDDSIQLQAQGDGTETAIADRWQAVMDTPLPWDHLDTGIDKAWLQDDLRRALAAAVVPDCSFEGCSHCGVCGTDFGHNIVVPPPPIPNFEGHTKPKSERVQRLRITLGKLGDMALIGHLDLARMLDRAVRRAALPISFTGGFHPGPRIAPANALSLGATSTGEIIDFELTETMDVAEFRERLQTQLADTLPIYDAEAVPLRAPSATKALEQADYLLAIGVSGSGYDWQTWIDQVLDQTEILDTHTTKSGKVKQINLRERLQQLELVAHLPEHLPEGVCQKLQAGDIILRYVGSCRNDGNMLRPEHVMRMLEQLQETPTLSLIHIHRQQLILASLNH